MTETQVQSLGQEGPLEEEMGIYSSTLAGKIPWTEEPRGLESMELQRIGRDCATEHVHTQKVRIVLFVQSSVT